jgi:hypothetical protein
MKSPSSLNKTPSFVPVFVSGAVSSSLVTAKRKKLTKFQISSVEKEGQSVVFTNICVLGRKLGRKLLLNRGDLVALEGVKRQDAGKDSVFYAHSVHVVGPASI